MSVSVPVPVPVPVPVGAGAGAGAGADAARRCTCVAQVHAYVEEMPLWELSAFDSAVVSLKSFALAAALVHGR